MSDHITNARDNALRRGSREIQVRLTDSGELELAEQPVSWDGEPVYSPATVAEGLFDGGAFKQMKGQLTTFDDADGLFDDACDNCGGPYGYPSAHAVGCPFR